MDTAIKSGKRRHALTMLEKQIICRKREEPEFAKEKLSEFGKHFLDDQGLPIPTSTLSDFLKKKDKWLDIDIAGGGT